MLADSTSQRHYCSILPDSTPADVYALKQAGCSSWDVHRCLVTVQGSVWGSGLAGIVCAGIALLYGDNSHVWQVWLVEVHNWLPV